MLFSYRIRHDEVLKCIHLSISRMYKFTENHKLRLHKMTKFIENEHAKIITDMIYITTTNIKFNKPDMIVFDILNRKITIIEIRNIYNPKSLKRNKNIQY